MSRNLVSGSAVDSGGLSSGVADWHSPVVVVVFAEGVWGASLPPTAGLVVYFEMRVCSRAAGGVYPPRCWVSVGVGGAGRAKEVGGSLPCVEAFAMTVDVAVVSVVVVSSTERSTLPGVNLPVNVEEFRAIAM